MSTPNLETATQERCPYCLEAGDRCDRDPCDATYDHVYAGARDWVVIDREHNPRSLAIGPYSTLADAVHAMEHAPLIAGFCEDDATGCEAVTWEHQPAPENYEVVIIDPADPHHTGKEV